MLISYPTARSIITLAKRKGFRCTGRAEKNSSAKVVPDNDELTSGHYSAI
jgi:hypothetical protein